MVNRKAEQNLIEPWPWNLRLILTVTAQSSFTTPWVNIVGRTVLPHWLTRGYWAPAVSVTMCLNFGLHFHLMATPNFAARLRELGIDIEAYEKKNYTKIPVVSVPN
jgi:hypothetical protein